MLIGEAQKIVQVEGRGLLTGKGWQVQPLQEAGVEVASERIGQDGKVALQSGAIRRDQAFWEGGRSTSQILSASIGVLISRHHYTAVRAQMAHKRQLRKQLLLSEVCGATAVLTDLLLDRGDRPRDAATRVASSLMDCRTSRQTALSFECRKQITAFIQFTRIGIVSQSLKE